MAVNRVVVVRQMAALSHEVPCGIKCRKRRSTSNLEEEMTTDTAVEGVRTDTCSLDTLVGALNAMPTCTNSGFYRDFPDRFGPLIPKDPAEAKRVLETFVMTKVAERFALSHRDANLFFATALSYHEICEETPSKAAFMRELWEPTLRDLRLLKAAG